jgi:tetrahydromethanopterin S-methyltransferase subunit C
MGRFYEAVAEYFYVCCNITASCRNISCEASWEWTAWVIIGLVLLIVLSVLGTVQGKKIGMVVRSLNKDDEPLPDESKMKLTNPLFLRAFKLRFMTAAGIIFIMTTKTDWVGSIISIVIAFIVGYFIGLPSGEKVKELESA